MMAPPNHRLLRLAAGILFTGLIASYGCAASDSQDETSSAGTSSSQVGSGSGAGGGTTLTAGVGGSGGGFSSVQSGSGGADICEEVTADAEVVPLDVVLVLDRSGSMETSGLWTPFIKAMSDFISAPESAGLSVGMSFFPDASVNACPNGYGACKETLYGSSSSIPVALSELPMGEATLLTALQSQAAEGQCTPTFGALKGTLNFAMSHQGANPQRKTIVVLASDGAPNGCPATPIDANDPDEIAKLASNAFYFNGVQVFTIAIAGANVADLDKIAKAGGTTSAFDVTSDISAFLQKMQDIQGTVLACDFLIPDSGEGEFDAQKVNVVYTPGNGGTPKKIPQVSSPSACGDSDGWYYDNPAMPSKISLCKGSCDEVQADDMASVAVAFGCPTVIK